jgi:hypothetical protein
MDLILNPALAEQCVQCATIENVNPFLRQVLLSINIHSLELSSKSGEIGQSGVSWQAGAEMGLESGFKNWTQIKKLIQIKLVK